MRLLAHLAPLLFLLGCSDVEPALQKRLAIDTVQTVATESLEAKAEQPPVEVSEISPDVKESQSEEQSGDVAKPQMTMGAYLVACQWDKEAASRLLCRLEGARDHTKADLSGLAWDVRLPNGAPLAKDAAIVQSLPVDSNWHIAVELLVPQTILVLPYAGTLPPPDASSFATGPTLIVAPPAVAPPAVAPSTEPSVASPAAPVGNTLFSEDFYSLAPGSRFFERWNTIQGSPFDLTVRAFRCGPLAMQAGGTQDMTSARTKEHYDFSNATADARLLNITGKVPQNMIAFGVLGVTDGPEKLVTQAFFNIDKGSIGAEEQLGPTGTIFATKPYLPNEHRYLRIAHAQGVLNYLTSPDGSNWSTFATLARPWTASTVEILITCRSTLNYPSDIAIEALTLRGQ